MRKQIQPRDLQVGVSAARQPSREVASDIRVRGGLEGQGQMGPEASSGSEPLRGCVYQGIRGGGCTGMPDPLSPEHLLLQPGCPVL